MTMLTAAVFTLLAPAPASLRSVARVTRPARMGLFGFGGGGVSFVEASHILCEDEATAEALQSRIEAGELTFADAAVQFSKCPSGPQKKGDLESFSGGLWRVLYLPYEGKKEMTAAFDDLVFAPETALNTIHRVDTPWGTHLVTIRARS